MDLPHAFAVVLFMGAFIGLTVGWAGCLYVYSRNRLSRPANAIAILLPLTAATVWAAMAYRQQRVRIWNERLSQLQSVAAGAAPLLTSIRVFTNKNGSPPASLAAIPGAAPPPANVARTAAWSYGVPGLIIGPPSTPVSRWAIGFTVRRNFCSLCSVSFGDTFVYHSDGVYPKHLYGGVLERVGAWAYYHE